MPSEPFKNPKLFDLSDWESLTNSDDCNILLKFKEKRKAYLVDQCLAYIRKGDFHNAVRAEAKVEDVDKEIGFIKQNLTKLRIGGSNG